MRAMSETLAADVALCAVAAIMTCVAGAWVYLIRSMSATFRLVPYLDDDYDESDGGYDGGSGSGNSGGKDGAKPTAAASGPADSPMVSVILPARNEEGYIERCLESLAVQDYPNYEVVAIDDSSGDDTMNIIKRCARRHPGVIVPVSARPKPDGWMGKNWACMEGYRRAKGGLLLFTDADTRHTKGMIGLAVRRLLGGRLDALTVMPRMLAPEFWTRATLPMISVFLHTRFSALNVNSPDSKTGYFFGSFFIIRRETYLSVGAHEGVRGEMIEDGALGRRTKEAGHRMLMLRGEHLIEAVWARDGHTLWNALKRLMIPLRTQYGLRTATGIAAAVTFLLFAPFLALPSTAIPAAVAAASGGPWADLVPAVLAASASAVASALVWAGAVLESRTGLGIGVPYGLLAPVGGLVVAAGFLAGLVRPNPSLSWRGRTYTSRDQSADPFAAV